MGVKHTKPRPNAVFDLKKVKEPEAPRILSDSGGTVFAAPSSPTSPKRSRSVSLNADPEKERTYAVEPQEVVVEHGAAEPLGGEFLRVEARDLPGMPELPVQVGGSIRIASDGELLLETGQATYATIVLSIAPDGPLARLNARHTGAITVGTVILQTKKLSATCTNLAVGRWGWSVVVKKNPKIAHHMHPGARVEERSSFACITSIRENGSLDRSNRMNPMSMVAIGDCLVAVNGIAVSKWLEGAPDMLNKQFESYVRGDRQEWVVVRVPGAKWSTRSKRISQMIQSVMENSGTTAPPSSDGTDDDTYSEYSA